MTNNNNKGNTMHTITYTRPDGKMNETAHGIMSDRIDFDAMTYAYNDHVNCPIIEVGPVDATFLAAHKSFAAYCERFGTAAE